MFFSVFAIWTRSHCFELIASTEPTRGVFLFGGVLSSQNILYQNILDTAVTAIVDCTVVALVSRIPRWKANSESNAIAH